MLSTRYPQFPQACALAFCLLFSGSSAVAPADALADVGYVDQAALSNVGSFHAASQELAAEKERLDRQFLEAMRSAKTPADRQRLSQTFAQKYDDRRKTLLGPLLLRAQTAIASVASSKNLSVVVDKRIVITGGQDITPSVVQLLSGLAPPVPPVSTPPPSEVGFVDQTRVDAVPKIKDAMRTFETYRVAEETRTQQALRSAASDVDRQRLLKDYREHVADKQKQMMQPLLDQARAAVAKAAERKKLILVVDRDDVIYGGSDVTGDVVQALGG